MQLRQDTWNSLNLIGKWVVMHVKVVNVTRLPVNEHEEKFISKKPGQFRSEVTLVQFLKILDLSLTSILQKGTR